MAHSSPYGGGQLPEPAPSNIISNPRLSLSINTAYALHRSFSNPSTPVISISRPSTSTSSSAGHSTPTLSASSPSTPGAATTAAASSSSNAVARPTCSENLNQWLSAEDKRDRSLMAIIGAFASINNQALCVKELVDLVASLSLLPLRGQTPTGTLNSAIRNHVNRCFEREVPSILTRHTLSGDVSDERLSPAIGVQAIEDASGESVVHVPADMPKDKVYLRNKNGKTRKGVYLYFLSEWTGFENPFKRQGFHDLTYICEGPEEAPAHLPTLSTVDFKSLADFRYELPPGYVRPTVPGKTLLDITAPKSTKKQKKTKDAASGEGSGTTLEVETPTRVESAADEHPIDVETLFSTPSMMTPATELAGPLFAISLIEPTPPGSPRPWELKQDGAGLEDFDDVFKRSRSESLSSNVSMSLRAPSEASEDSSDEEEEAQEQEDLTWRGHTRQRSFDFETLTWSGDDAVEEEDAAGEMDEDPEDERSGTPSTLLSSPLSLHSALRSDSVSSISATSSISSIGSFTRDASPVMPSTMAEAEKAAEAGRGLAHFTSSWSSHLTPASASTSSSRPSNLTLTMHRRFNSRDLKSLTIPPYHPKSKLLEDELTSSPFTTPASARSDASTFSDSSAAQEDVSPERLSAASTVVPPHSAHRMEVDVDEEMLHQNGDHRRLAEVELQDLLIEPEGALHELEEAWGVFSETPSSSLPSTPRDDRSIEGNWASPLSASFEAAPLTGGSNVCTLRPRSPYVVDTSDPAAVYSAGIAVPMHRAQQMIPEPAQLHQTHVAELSSVSSSSYASDESFDSYIANGHLISLSPQVSTIPLRTETPYSELPSATPSPSVSVQGQKNKVISNSLVPLSPPIYAAIIDGQLMFATRYGSTSVLRAMDLDFVNLSHLMSLSEPKISEEEVARIIGSCPSSVTLPVETSAAKTNSVPPNSLLAGTWVSIAEVHRLRAEGVLHLPHTLVENFIRENIVELFPQNVASLIESRRATASFSPSPSSPSPHPSPISPSPASYVPGASALHHHHPHQQHQHHQADGQQMTMMYGSAPATSTPRVAELAQLANRMAEAQIRQHHQQQFYHSSETGASSSSSSSPYVMSNAPALNHGDSDRSFVFGGTPYECTIPVMAPPPPPPMIYVSQSAEPVSPSSSTLSSAPPSEQSLSPPASPAAAGTGAKRRVGRPRKADVLALKASASEGSIVSLAKSRATTLPVSHRPTRASAKAIRTASASKI